VRAEEFSELYGVNINTIHQQSSTNHPLIYRVGYSIRVKVDKLKARHNFRRKVWLKNHDNYYAITEYISENKLAGLLARYTDISQQAWVTYMNQKLFRLLPETLSFRYKLSPKDWLFFRYTTFMIKRIERLWNEN